MVSPKQDRYRKCPVHLPAPDSSQRGRNAVESCLQLAERFAYNVSQGSAIIQEISMKRMFISPVALSVLALAPAFAQRKATIQNVPEIPFTTVPNFLKLPPGEYMGTAVAVATNSQGHTFVFHRSNNNRLFEFDQTRSE